MATKSSQEVLSAFEHYEKDLNRLLQALKSAGKSGSALSLMQSLTMQDIGMLSWGVPENWRSEASDFPARFETVLDRIRRDVAVLRSDFVPAEGGLPTLAMLADQISASVGRVIGAAPETVPSSHHKTNRPSHVYGFLAFLKRLFSTTANPDRPIMIDSEWNPGTKLKLMSYTEAVRSLRSGDHERMADAIANNILNAPNVYNDISTSLGSSSDGRLTDLLLPLLKHDEYGVRCCIPAILEEIGDQRFVPHLEEVVQHDRSEQLVRNARSAIERIKSRSANTEAVEFSRSYTKPIPSPLGGAEVTGTYDEYTAPNRVVARAFLDNTPVPADFHYIEIITPEGNLGKDKMGVY